MTYANATGLLPKVRKVRHFKQRLRDGVRMAWRRPVLWNGIRAIPGEPVPEELQQNRVKLSRFWRSGCIEIYEYEEPPIARVDGSMPYVPAVPVISDVVDEVDAASGISSGVAATAVVDGDSDGDDDDNVLPDGVTVEHVKGSWYKVTVDGIEHKLNGKRALDKFLSKVHNAKEAEAEGARNVEDWLD